jgi:hypothetical protein
MAVKHFMRSADKPSRARKKRLSLPNCPCENITGGVGIDRPVIQSAKRSALDQRLKEMKSRRFSVIIFSMLFLTGCADYSTRYIDEQKSLYEKYKQGQISQEEYDQALLEKRDEDPWGATGEARTPAFHLGSH